MIDKFQKMMNKKYPIKNKDIKTKLYYLENNNYTLLIAIILSCNTSDNLVNKVTPILFKKANTPTKMIQLGIEKIKSIISPIGLANKKAKYIYDTSCIIMKRSKIPTTKKELIKLPGVGNKVAGVYLINIKGSVDFPVDRHVKRIALKYKLTKHKDPNKISEDLKEIFPKRNWKKLHYQMIEASRNEHKNVNALD